MSSPDGFQRPPLRYRRLGGGYRREDVDFAFGELGLTLRQLGQDLEAVRERNSELEEQLATARSEIESLRAKETELFKTMSAALRHADDIEEAASARAGEIVAGAEEEALRIRAEAGRRLEESSARFDELLRVKDNLLEAMRRVVADFGQAISRVEQVEPPAPAVPLHLVGEAAREPTPEAASPEPEILAVTPPPEQAASPLVSPPVSPPSQR